MPVQGVLAFAVAVDDGEPYIHYATFNREEDARAWIESRRADADKMKFQAFRDVVIDIASIVEGDFRCSPTAVM
ncbi:MAG: hypothetical protein NUW37_18845 [Planctomycetes bacterium]|nr:hypothetical protein [Planctomycetota bacterium]